MKIFTSIPTNIMFGNSEFETANLLKTLENYHGDRKKVAISRFRQLA